MPVSVRYIVDDLEAAIRFYTDQLGFGVETHPAPASQCSPSRICGYC